MKVGDKIELKDDPHEYIIVECLSTTKAVVKNIWSGKKSTVDVSDVKPPRSSGYREINWGPGF